MSGSAWPLGDPIERLKAHLIALGEWSEERHSDAEQGARSARDRLLEGGASPTAR